MFLYDLVVLGFCFGICVVELEGVDLSGIEGFYCYNLCECDLFVIECMFKVLEICFGKWFG